jgi:hypothetical protein
MLSRKEDFIFMRFQKGALGWDENISSLLTIKFLLMIRKELEVL